MAYFRRVEASKSIDPIEKLEEASEIVDLRRGDVIFATRLLFHRTLAVTPEGLEFFAKNGKEALLRYSIRYVPGSATLIKGLSSEWSVLDNSANFGRTLDEVAATNIGIPKCGRVLRRRSVPKRLRLTNRNSLKSRRKKKNYSPKCGQ
jgi:hypothetical protein